MQLPIVEPQLFLSWPSNNIQCLPYVFACTVHTPCGGVETSKQVKAEFFPSHIARRVALISWILWPSARHQPKMQDRTQGPVCRTMCLLPPTCTFVPNYTTYLWRKCANDLPSVALECRAVGYRTNTLTTAPQFIIIYYWSWYLKTLGYHGRTIMHNVPRRHPSCHENIVNWMKFCRRYVVLVKFVVLLCLISNVSLIVTALGEYSVSFVECQVVKCAVCHLTARLWPFQFVKIQSAFFVTWNLCRVHLFFCDGVRWKMNVIRELTASMWYCEEGTLRINDFIIQSVIQNNSARLTSVTS